MRRNANPCSKMGNAALSLFLCQQNEHKTIFFYFDKRAEK